MSVIDHVRLRRLDLTVLLVFLGLIRLRKATAVGRDLGLTQSAVSHALKRLRDIFGDELFLRRPHGLEPTAVALALEPSVREAVDALSNALAGTEPFDPGSATGLVRIGAYDSALSTIVPTLIHKLSEIAPGLQISALTLGRREALDALASGRIDIAIGFLFGVGPDVVQRRLYEESYRVVCRAGDANAEGTLTLPRYLAARHVIVSPVGDLRGVVDEALARSGRTRQVIAALPLFLPTLAVVASTGAMATLPSQVVEAHAARFGLVSKQPPLAIRSFPVSAVCHRRNARSPRHEWLMRLLCEIGGASPTGP